MSLKQIGSTILTFIIYALLLNWKIAILVCLGIGWHEYCHILAAKRIGMKTGGFYLIPFMGGISFVTERYKTFFQRTFVVIMGPVGGSIPGFILGGLFYLTGSKHLWMAAAAEWFMVVNLFNLLPLSFMDGGQLAESVAYSINETVGLICYAGGTIIGIVLLLKLNVVIACAVIFMGLPQVYNAYLDWKYLREGKTWKLSAAYLERPELLSKKEIVITAVAYLSAALVLGAFYVLLSSTPGISLMYFVRK